MRLFLTSIVLLGLLSACDRETSAVPRLGSADSPNTVEFDDEFGGGTSFNNSLLRLHSRIASTSADGNEADVVLSYSIDPYIRPALKSGTYVRFDYLSDQQPARLLARDTVTDDLGGTVSVTVPTTFHNANIKASIIGLEPGVINETGTLLSVTPAIPKTQTTDLANIGGVQMTLIDRSYESEIINGRRVHSFAVQVTDPTAQAVFPDGGKPDDFHYSISGLEENASDFFKVYENQFIDIESPVTVNFERHKQAVYLLIDKSKSIVESRQAHNVADAVSRSVIALSDNADFDYRWFSQTVERVSSLRELDFDSDDASGTALYYALDRTLSDIENVGSIHQDKIVIVFTDGIDLSSRNYYNGDFIDNEQVFDYVKQRVAQVRSSQFNHFGRQLKVYTMGFYPDGEGIDIPMEINKLDEIAEVGGTESSYNNQNSDSIVAAFDAVVQNIQGVYYLQYSSQQTADNNQLQLTLTIDGHEPVSVELPVSVDSSE